MKQGMIAALLALGCAAQRQQTSAPEAPHDPTEAEIVAQEKEQARLEAEKVRAAQERARQAQLLMDYDARMEAANKDAARDEPARKEAPPPDPTASGEPPASADAQPTNQPQKLALADSNQPQHLALPGWEDIIVGKTRPTSLHAKCKREPDSEAVICKACRSANLPTPCVEVVLDGPAPKNVSMIMVTLPPSDRDARLLINKVSEVWGLPTSHMPDALLEELDWDGRQECASLVTSWMDTSGPTIRRARQARRVITIRAGGC